MSLVRSLMTAYVNAICINVSNIRAFDMKTWHLSSLIHAQFTLDCIYLMDIEYYTYGIIFYCRMYPNLQLFCNLLYNTISMGLTPGKWWINDLSNTPLPSLRRHVCTGCQNPSLLWRHLLEREHVCFRGCQGGAGANFLRCCGQTLWPNIHPRVTHKTCSHCALFLG